MFEILVNCFSRNLVSNEGLFNRFAHPVGSFLVPSDSYVSGWLLGDWLLGDKLLGSKYSINNLLTLRAVELILRVWDAY